MYVFRFEEGEYPGVKLSFLPRPCQHCDNAPCAKVCPVGARYKRDDGLVATDFDRCIGCRYCEVACPYGVNNFNWMDPADNYYLDWNAKEAQPVAKATTPPWDNPDLDKVFGPENRRIAGGGHTAGVMEKCTFCVQRLDEGLQPACVDNCPVQAFAFGDLDDPNSGVSKALELRPSFRLLEEAGTEPRVFYLGDKHPESDVRQIESVEARI